jgi:type IX secretion system PorP/SprF family membrane protein
MFMKKTWILYCLCLFVQMAFGQQRPHYTQYILNNYILNPALSGIENYTDLKISGRDQWVGLTGAPQTAYISMHTPIGKRDYKTSATSFRVPGENPRGTSYWESYTASEPHHGVGFTLINDKTGLYNLVSLAATYAYHIGLSATTNLSAGFSAGATNIRFDMSQAKADNPSDPALAAGGSVSRLRPDIGAGLWLYSPNYFVGLSAQEVLPQKVSFVKDDRYAIQLIPHFFATAGHRFLLNEDINALPSIILKIVPGSPTMPQFDMNCKLQYQDLLWIGGSYRLNDSYAAMLGLNVGNTFNVSYAYELAKTPLTMVSNGTHELMIGFLLGNKYSDTCPRNLW